MYVVYTDDEKLQEAQTMDEVWSVVFHYLRGQGIKPPYYRVFQDPVTRKNIVDYGSHSNFIYFELI